MLSIITLCRLLLKVCHTLRSYQRDVRDVARSTLVKIATLLGPKYLYFIVKEMKEALTKGYQVWKNRIFQLTLYSVGIGSCVKLQYILFTKWS